MDLISLIEVATDTRSTPSGTPFWSIQSCRAGTSRWQWTHQWARNKIIFGVPSFSIEAGDPSKASDDASGMDIPRAGSSAGLPPKVGSAPPETVTLGKAKPPPPGSLASSPASVTPSTTTAASPTKTATAMITFFPRPEVFSSSGSGAAGGGLAAGLSAVFAFGRLRLPSVLDIVGAPMVAGVGGGLRASSNPTRGRPPGTL